MKNQYEYSNVLLAYKYRESEHQNIWYMNSGANNYMYGIKEFFTMLDDSIDVKVAFGD